MDAAEPDGRRWEACCPSAARSSSPTALSQVVRTSSANESTVSGPASKSSGRPGMVARHSRVSEWPSKGRAHEEKVLGPAVLAVTLTALVGISSTGIAAERVRLDCGRSWFTSNTRTEARMTTSSPQVFRRRRCRRFWRTVAGLPGTGLWFGTTAIPSLMTTLRAAPALWRRQACPWIGARADTVRAACRTGA